MLMVLVMLLQGWTFREHKTTQVPHSWVEAIVPGHDEYLLFLVSLSLPISFYSYDAFPSAECLSRITPAIPPLLFPGPHLQGKPPAPPETTMDTKTSDPKSEGNPLLSQRPPQTSEVQPPTQMETFHSTTKQSSQKNREEMETDEQNICPIKTNSEIIT